MESWQSGNADVVKAKFVILACSFFRVSFYCLVSAVVFAGRKAFFYVNYPEFLLPLDKKYIYFSICGCWLVLLEHLAAAGLYFEAWRLLW